MRSIRSSFAGSYTSLLICLPLAGAVVPAAADPSIASVNHIFDLVLTTETIQAEEADEEA